MSVLLIAENDPTVAEVLSRMLWVAGRTVLTCATAAEALRVAQERGPVDVAIVDRYLDSDSGLALARDLRSVQETEVVLVTAYASTDSAVEAFQAGVYDYVTKPIDDFDALRLRIGNAFERVRLRRERKALAERLAESEARYRRLFESAPDPVVAFDLRDGLVREANPAAAARFGVPRDAFLDRPAASLFVEPPPWLAAPAAPKSPKIVRCAGAHGEAFPAALRSVDLELGGRPVRAITFRDLSERERLLESRRQVEQQLRQSQKMDALGRLAGGIGHDLANKFAVILSYVEELSTRAGAEDRVCLDAVQEAANRATWLVRQMMTLARKAPATPTVVSLGSTVEGMQGFLRRSLGEQYALETRLDPGLWPVLVDPNRFGQVALNLVLNARDAMPGGGRIVLRTENVPPEDREQDGLPPGPLVRFSVEDEGSGMAPEVLDRIFEPFFTTKSAGKGTGLGLSICHGIVHQAGGTIVVDSAPGRGTTVKVLFPRAEADAVREVELPPVPAAEESSGGTALVAEDDEAVRMLVARVLRQDGFAVLARPTGEDALQASEEHEGPIDLLVTDAVMGRLSGPALVTGVRRRHPACRVLLLTGFPAEPSVVEFAERGGDVLVKPFRASDLRDRIRRLSREG